MEMKKTEEFTRVQRESDNKYNLIDANGNYLFNEWFYWVGTFNDGFAIVGRENHKYNHIDTKGKLLSNEWFKWVDYFKDGFAVVKRAYEK